MIPKGPKSGWTYETTPLDHGHPWQCALCHPPADGLNIEIQEAWPGDALTPSATNPISGRLTWRPGYRWRRDGQPDGEPLPPIVEKSGAWSYELAQEPRVNRAYVDPDEPPIIDRYAERSEKRAEIKANAQAWQRLTHMAAGQR